MEKFTHLGVYGVLVQQEKILLIKKARGPHTGKWDLPGGTIEFGEEPYAALKREFDEETGLTGIEARIRSAESYTLIHPYKEDELEELHHIGIIYDILSFPDSLQLRTTGDGEDSLGACFIGIEDIVARRVVVTPFVMAVLRDY